MLKIRLTLGRLFVFILVTGVICLAFIGYVLLRDEQEKTLLSWQMSTLQRSSASTSSYYSNLITSLVVEDKENVNEILRMAKSSERLEKISIVPESEITKYILETCEVDKSQSFFQQLPTCIEYSGKYLLVYHELRSMGYNIGYLKKEIPVPKMGIFDNTSVLRSFLFVVLCFVFINVLVLFVLRKFIIKPIGNIIESLKTNHKDLKYAVQTSGIEEIRTIASSMQDAFISIENYQSKAKELEYEAKIGKLASQVAHDIRSPLAALHAAMSTLTGIEESKRLFVRRAVQRIDDIANELIGKSKKIEEQFESNTKSKTGVYLLSSLIEPIISEKRLQYRSRVNVLIDFQINAENYGLFAKINPIQFRRAISNIINNSVEAFQNDAGHVDVRLKQEESDIVIEIEDNGIGISKENISHLMEKGASFGKKGGLGIGLYHAKETISAWGGRIVIFSEQGVGTTVKIALPRSREPDWFVPALTIPKDARIIILDDDESIHGIWKGRFGNTDLPNSSLFHFSNPDDVIEWYGNNQHDLQPEIYLFDYELIGSAMNGLKVIQKLGIEKKAILITSRYDEEDIRGSCRDLKIRMIPKALAGFVPIRISNPNNNSNKLECVLIDDNDITRDNWSLRAEISGKRIFCFEHPSEFWENAHHIDKDTPIYIDSNLSDGLKGEKVSHEIFSRGYENIHLATGSQPEEFRHAWWIKSIIGKEPPFDKAKGTT